VAGNGLTALPEGNRSSGCCRRGPPWRGGCPLGQWRKTPGVCGQRPQGACRRDASPRIRW
jgi:hypothetical protein